MRQSNPGNPRAATRCLTSRHGWLATGCHLLAQGLMSMASAATYTVRTGSCTHSTIASALAAAERHARLPTGSKRAIRVARIRLPAPSPACGDQRTAAALCNAEDPRYWNHPLWLAADRVGKDRSGRESAAAGHRTHRCGARTYRATDRTRTFVGRRGPSRRRKGAMTVRKQGSGTCEA